MADELRRSLSGIVSDLWGTPSPAEEPAPAASPAPDFPPFEQLWSAVDETVDWTEALVHDAPTDALTSPAQWALYRRYAPAVLAGDPKAYLDVLKAVDPLQDLTSWADRFDVARVDADALRVTFFATPALYRQEGRRYIAGMSLRIARDLLALLPLLRVDVTVQCEGTVRMQVTFQRSDLQKVRFSFIDPVDFSLQCGAVFTD